MKNNITPKRTVQWLRTHKCKHYHNFLVHPKCLGGYKEPTRLYIDIEISPTLGYAWEMFEANLLKIKEEWKILCIGYKWKGGKTRILYGNEKKICQGIRNLLDKADVVVGYNGDKFDLKKINTRIAYYRIRPPSPYKSYDPLKRLRKYFGLLSNSLKYVVHYYQLGEKMETGGKELWFDYMAGKPSAIKKMHRYCKRDVDCLEKADDFLQEWEMR